MSNGGKMDKEVMEFRSIAKERWVYLENGDSKNGNKCFDRLGKLVSTLKDRNDLEKLVVLLDDMDDGVKFEAASKLLSLYPNESESALKCVSQKKGVLPFAAKQTLKQLKK